MRDGIVNEDWHVIHGGDGFYAAIDNVEPWMVYTESQDGYIDRHDMRTGSSDPFGRKPKRESRLPLPVEFARGGSAHEHTTVYYAEIICSVDGSRDNWTGSAGFDHGRGPQQITNLRKTPDKIPSHGTTAFRNIPPSQRSANPIDANVLGWVRMTQCASDARRRQDWKNVASKVPGVPKGTYVSRVVASKTGDGVALLHSMGIRDDNNVYVFATTTTARAGRRSATAFLIRPEACTSCASTA